MFGVSRAELIANLLHLGDTCCQYGGGDWLTRHCDCKYGASLRGEESGCPELRLLVELLLGMQDNEYEALCRRANVIGIDDLVLVVSAP